MLQSLRNVLPSWRFKHSKKKAETPPASGEQHLDLARESLLELLGDQRVPAQVRESLAQDYSEVEGMLQRLQQGHLHIAVFGRVSVGKSALLNALLGEQKFSTSPLHGETKTATKGEWQEYKSGGIFLIDTPGINEIDGETREQLAHQVASRAELVIFVADGDLIESEINALKTISSQHRPIVLVLNKKDRYSAEEQSALVERLAQHSKGVVLRENIVPAAADPAEQLTVVVDQSGKESSSYRKPAPDVSLVRERLWDIIQSEGRTLVAINASLFAGRLSDQVGARILQVRSDIGQKVIHTYCTAKGVAVAFNPVPVTDLVAAAVVDISMVVHLSKIYGLPLTRGEAGNLVKTIGAQMMLLMGTVWAVHFVSSALKLGSGGFSALITGGAQGAVAYYSTYVVGKATEQYLSQGKSWGEHGPKYVVRHILEHLDRDSIMEQAKKDIKARLGAT